jgi:hypothetical protein
MTDRDSSVPSEPIDSEIRAAIDAAETRVEIPPGDDLIDAARGARDRQSARRHRTVRIVVGTAAAVVLAVAGVAVGLSRGGSDTKLVATGSSATEGTGSASTSARPSGAPLTVDPNTGLVDGQRVSVTVRGGFDFTHLPIRVMQCVAIPAGGWWCDRSTSSSVPSVPGEHEPRGTATFEVRAELSNLVVIRPGTDPDESTERSPADQSASCIASPEHMLHRSDAPDAASTAGDGAADDAGSTASFGGHTTASPCVIVAFGPLHGNPATQAAPIWFGSDGPTSTAPDGPATSAPDGPDSPASDGDSSSASPLQSATSTSGTAQLPIPPDQARDMCPSRPVRRELSDAAPGDAAPLLDFTPTEVIVCTYRGTEQSGGSILSPGAVDRLVRDLASLEPVPDDPVCTAEAGPTVGAIATDGTRTATIWFQLYGCGLAFDGDHNRIGAKSLSWLTG